MNIAFLEMTTTYIIRRLDKLWHVYKEFMQA